MQWTKQARQYLLNISTQIFFISGDRETTVENIFFLSPSFFSTSYYSTPPISTPISYQSHLNYAIGGAALVTKLFLFFSYLSPLRQHVFLTWKKLIRNRDINHYYWQLHLLFTHSLCHLITSLKLPFPFLKKFINQLYILLHGDIMRCAKLDLFDCGAEAPFTLPISVPSNIHGNTGRDKKRMFCGHIFSSHYKKKFLFCNVSSFVSAGLQHIDKSKWSDINESKRTTDISR